MNDRPTARARRALLDVDRLAAGFVRLGCTPDEAWRIAGKLTVERINREHARRVERVLDRRARETETA